MAKGAVSVKKIGVLPIERLNFRKLNLTKAQTMELVAEASLNHFLEGFRKGGGQTDASKSGWQKRKDNVGSEGRAILVKSGDLRRDIDVITVSEKLIIIGTKRIPYAVTHNEGGRVPERRPRRKALKFTVGGETVFAKRAAAFDMPKREFIGPTKALEMSNAQIIKINMGKPLRIAI